MPNRKYGCFFLEMFAFVLFGHAEGEGLDLEFRKPCLFQPCLAPAGRMPPNCIDEASAAAPAARGPVRLHTDQLFSHQSLEGFFQRCTGTVHFLMIKQLLFHVFLHPNCSFCEILC